MLQQGENHSQHQSAAHSEQGHEPALKHENPFQQSVPGSGGAKGFGIPALLDDEHGEGTEDVEGYDDDHEEQDEVHGELFVAHQLVEGLVAAVAVHETEVRTQGGGKFAFAGLFPARPDPQLD